jgi:hypothetical protein
MPRASGASCRAPRSGWLEFLIILAVLAFVAWLVTGPLRRPAAEEDERTRAELADLEAAREAKYREIRDAELDRRTGKLSQQDFEAVDRALRAEAIEILRALDEARERVNGHAERLPSAKP